VIVKKLHIGLDNMSIADVAARTRATAQHDADSHAFMRCAGRGFVQREEERAPAFR
jgi:hypothetical protein